MPKSLRVGKQTKIFMKSTFGIFVTVLVAAFYSCQKDNVSLGVSSSISSDGVFSGTIVNDSNRIDSIKVYHFCNNEFLGKSGVSSTGKFSLALTNPVLRKMVTSPSGVVVSDTTAMVDLCLDLMPIKAE
jgi:hypothetical protein